MPRIKKIDTDFINMTKGMREQNSIPRAYPFAILRVANQNLSEPGKNVATYAIATKSKADKNGSKAYQTLMNEICPDEKIKHSGYHGIFHYNKKSGTYEILSGTSKSSFRDKDVLETIKKRSGHKNVEFVSNDQFTEIINGDSSNDTESYLEGSDDGKNLTNRNFGDSETVDDTSDSERDLRKVKNTIAALENIPVEADPDAAKALIAAGVDPTVKPTTPIWTNTEYSQIYKDAMLFLEKHGRNRLNNNIIQKDSSKDAGYTLWSALSAGRSGGTFGRAINTSSSDTAGVALSVATIELQLLSVFPAIYESGLAIMGRSKTEKLIQTAEVYKEKIEKSVEEIQEKIKNHQGSDQDKEEMIQTLNAMTWVLGNTTDLIAKKKRHIQNFRAAKAEYLEETRKLEEQLEKLKEDRKKSVEPEEQEKIKYEMLFKIDQLNKRKNIQKYPHLFDQKIFESCHDDAKYTREAWLLPFQTVAGTTASGFGIEALAHGASMVTDVGGGVAGGVGGALTMAMAYHDFRDGQVEHKNAKEKLTQVRHELVYAGTVREKFKRDSKLSGSQKEIALNLIDCYRSWKSRDRENFRRADKQALIRRGKGKASFGAGALSTSLGVTTAVLAGIGATAAVSATGIGAAVVGAAAGIGIGAPYFASVAIRSTARKKEKDKAKMRKIAADLFFEFSKEKGLIDLFSGKPAATPQSELQRKSLAYFNGSESYRNVIYEIFMTHEELRKNEYLAAKYVQIKLAAASLSAADDDNAKKAEKDKDFVIEILSSLGVADKAQIESIIKNVLQIRYMAGDEITDSYLRDITLSFFGARHFADEQLPVEQSENIQQNTQNKKEEKSHWAGLRKEWQNLINNTELKNYIAPPEEMKENSKGKGIVSADNPQDLLNTLIKEKVNLAKFEYYIEAYDAGKEYKAYGKYLSGLLVALQAIAEFNDPDPILAEASESLIMQKCLNTKAFDLRDHTIYGTRPLQPYEISAKFNNIVTGLDQVNMGSVMHVATEYAKTKVKEAGQKSQDDFAKYCRPLMKNLIKEYNLAHAEEPITSYGDLEDKVSLLLTGVRNSALLAKDFKGNTRKNETHAAASNLGTANIAVYLKVYMDAYRNEVTAIVAELHEKAQVKTQANKDKVKILYV